MTFFEIYMVTGVIIWAMVSALWLISLVRRDSSVIDPFWGAGFVVVGWVYFALSTEGLPARQWLILAMVTVWGLRLSGYLLARYLHKGEEDFRYQEFRRRGGPAYWWLSYFKVFLLQGVIMWLISMPLLAAQYGTGSAALTWLDYLGLLVWAIGFFFEAVGDWQLARFKANPANKGQLFTGGVWRYTRHPNYFGDAAQWWGFYLIALAAGGWWTIFSPLAMTFLLMKVSGVTLLEKTLTTTKPGYQDYVASTSAFVPWRPRGGKLS